MKRYLDDPAAAAAAIERGLPPRAPVFLGRERPDPARRLLARPRRMIPTHPLTIGIDARELLGEPTGVGRYLGELLRRWTARADAATRRLVLYTPEPLPFVRTVPDTRGRAGGGRRKRPRDLVGADASPARRALGLRRTCFSPAPTPRRWRSACRSPSRSTTSRSRPAPNGSGRAKGRGGGS